MNNPEHQSSANSPVSKNPELGTDFEIRWFDAWALFCKKRWGKPEVAGEEPVKFVPMTGVEGWAKFCHERYAPKPLESSE